MPDSPVLDELVLHVGHSKTGTTTLQHTLRQSRSILSRHGLLYPIDRDTDGDVARLFAQDAVRAEAGRRNLAQRLRRLARRSPTRQALISSEVLSALKIDEKRAMLRFFDTLATRVRVLLYVRHPLGFAVSSLQQAVKGGRSTYEEVCREPRFRSIARLVGDWHEVAGSRLVLRIYDRRTLVNGDIVDDVLDSVGRAELAARLDRVQANEGISIPAAILLGRRTELARAGLAGLIDAASLRGVAGPPFALPEETMRHLAGRAARDVGILERRFGIVFPEPRFAVMPDEIFDRAACVSLVELLSAVGASQPAGLRRIVLPTWLRGADAAPLRWTIR